MNAKGRYKFEVRVEQRKLSPIIMPLYKIVKACINALILMNF